MGIHDTIVGLDQFMAYLRTLGYEVEPAPDELRQRLGSGLLSGDQHCISVAGRNVDLISLRTEGMVGLMDNLRHRAGTLSVGRVPVSSRTVLPLRVHYVVLCEPAQARPDLAAKLRLIKRGLIRRQVVAGRWRGERLARALNCDPQTMSGLLASLGPGEGIMVKPDPGAGCVRVVHRSVRVLDFSLFKKNLVSFHQTLAPPQLLTSIERVAWQVRQLLQAA